MTAKVLYIAARLPALSETFVYNEVLGLRRVGVNVAVASVHAPQRELGDEALDALAEEAVTVYGDGAGALLAAALAEIVTHPLRGLGTLIAGLGDALLGRDVPAARRPKLFWQCLGGLALARRIRARGIAHIHAHMAHVPTSIAMYAARQLGIGFSFTGHANDIFQQRTLLPAKLRRAAFVACISHWHRAYYREYADLPDQRLPIVRCGVHLPDEAPPRAESDAPPLIVAVGRLIPKKGFDLLVRAVARLIAEGERCRCQIIGGGPQQQYLEGLIAGEKVGAHVELAGPQTHKVVKRMVAQGDIFALPCRVDPTGDRDGIPVALMEAMAAGVCAISGDLPAIRELIKHDETGMMIPPGDVDALVDVLRRLINAPGLRSRLAEQGRAHVRAEFSDEVNLARIRSALDRATRRSAASTIEEVSAPS